MLPLSPCQKVLPPLVLAQLGNKWEVVELLTEKYGCSIDASLISSQQVTISCVMHSE